jgi:hypothetical protein
VRRLATVFLAAALALPGGSALAQTTGDLEVQVVQGPAPVTPPTSQGEVRFRIINHGPDPVGFTESGSDTGITLHIANIPFREQYGAAFIAEGITGDMVSAEFGIENPPPPAEPTALYYLRFPVLQPGESWDLTIQYGINFLADELAPDGYFTLSVRTGLFWDIDPNMDNNETFMHFRLAPPAPIPTLDATGLMVFALALAGAFFVLRRAKAPKPGGSGRDG